MYDEGALQRVARPKKKIRHLPRRVVVVVTRRNRHTGTHRGASDYTTTRTTPDKCGAQTARWCAVRSGAALCSGCYHQVRALWPPALHRVTLAVEQPLHLLLVQLVVLQPSARASPGAHEARQPERARGHKGPVDELEENRQRWDPGVHVVRHTHHVRRVAAAICGGRRLQRTWPTSAVCRRLGLRPEGGILRQEGRQLQAEHEAHQLHQHCDEQQRLRRGGRRAHAVEQQARDADADGADGEERGPEEEEHERCERDEVEREGRAARGTSARQVGSERFDAFERAGIGGGRAGGGGGGVEGGCSHAAGWRRRA